MARVLVVDDEEGIRKTSAVFLREAGHEVETAGTVAEASEKVAGSDFDVILSDIVMPGDDGIRLLEFVRSRAPLTQFILITGEPTIETATDALRLGAFDYLSKPLKKGPMCRVVEKAGNEKKMRQQLETLHEENRRHREELQLLVAERTAELKDALARLATTMESTILCLSMAMEKRDPYTAGHQRRVTDLACEIWDRLSLPREAREGLRIAGMMHDLGKLQVPAEILSKSTRLSKLEFLLIQEHPMSAWEILRLAEFPWPVATIVRQHHERLDGTGYPDGLKDADIMRESCVLAIADVVEAMASHRPYRAALGIDAALTEILRGRGTAYWPDAVDACVKAFREDGYALPTTADPGRG
ncbi:MAG: HD domain-containing phosphohydrolase [Myxococcota bacterium]